MWCAGNDHLHLLLFHFSPSSFLSISLVDSLLPSSPLSRTRFSLAELRKQPPPEGVDPTNLETYLSDEDFKVCCELVYSMALYELASFPGFPWLWIWIIQNGEEVLSSVT